jgi:HEAT repeat protein
MLSDLDTIDWASMRHAYGSAEDVPDLLLGLLSDDAGTRESALDDLYGGVHHQGDIYDSTVACIPFLLRIVAVIGAPDRGPLLELLESIGSSTTSAGEGSEDAMDAHCKQAHDAVLAGLRIYIECLADRDAVTRKGASKALTACWDRFDTVLPVLQQRFHDEPDQSTRIALIHAVGILARRHAAVGGDIGHVRPWLLFLTLNGENAAIRLNALTELAHVAPQELPEDITALAIANIEAAYHEGEVGNVTGEHVAMTDAPGGTSTTPTLIGMVRTLFHEEAEGKRLPEMYGVLNGLHDALSDRIQDRIILLAHELNALGWDRRSDAVWHALRLIRDWRGDYSGIAPLLGQQLDAPELRLRYRAAEALADMFTLAAPAADDLSRCMFSIPQEVERSKDDSQPLGWIIGNAVGPVTKALTRLGDGRVLPVLHWMLSRKKLPDDIGYVIRSFPDVCAGDFVPRICRRLSDALSAGNSDSTFRSLVYALGSFGPQAASAVPDLLALMQRERAKAYIMEALGRIGAPAAEACPGLRERLSSDDDGTIVSAAIALWRIEGNADEVLPVMIGNLGGRYTSDSVAALGQMGPAAAEAAPRLRELLSAPEPWRRRAAVVALWRITGDTQVALPALQGLWQENSRMRPDIALCFGQMGAAAAEVEPLLRQEIATLRRHNASESGHSSHQVHEDEALLLTCRSILDDITALKK